MSGGHCECMTGLFCVLVLPFLPHSHLHSFIPSFLPARILYARLLKVAERKDGVVQCLSDDMTLLIGTRVKLTDYLLNLPL